MGSGALQAEGNWDFPSLGALLLLLCFQGQILAAPPGLFWVEFQPGEAPQGVPGRDKPIPKSQKPQIPPELPRPCRLRVYRIRDGWNFPPLKIRDKGENLQNFPLVDLTGISRWPQTPPIPFPLPRLDTFTAPKIPIFASFLLTAATASPDLTSELRAHN